MRRGGDRNRGGGHEGGALFPFSGALALLGQESYRGLELAVNEINAAGGINGEKIQIVKADAVDPTQAVSETKRLISSNVIGVFGSYASGISYAASPVTELAGVPYSSWAPPPTRSPRAATSTCSAAIPTRRCTACRWSTPCTRPSRRAWG